MQNNYYPFINLPLSYSYDSLEPFIDVKTMYLHHDRHLQTYINNLNTALEEQPQLQTLSLEQLITNTEQLSDDLKQTIHNNAGGVYNHRFFFDLLSKFSTKGPTGPLATAIEETYGSFGQFMTTFKKAALSVFGSGYAWLVSNNNELMIITTANQNTPLEKGMHPILTIDVWEHAYYLKHYNLRSNYIDNWFHVINWEQAEANYIQIQHLPD